jgi:hypothetical protein
LSFVGRKKLFILNGAKRNFFNETIDVILIIDQVNGYVFRKRKLFEGADVGRVFHSCFVFLTNLWGVLRNCCKN